MRILEVNGTSLLGATHQEAVNALRAAGNDIQIVVCKGYDKSSLIHSIGSAGGMSTGFASGSNMRLGSRTSETGSELSQSVSSLDREDDDPRSQHSQHSQLSQVCFFYMLLVKALLTVLFLEQRWGVWYGSSTWQQNITRRCYRPIERCSVSEHWTSAGQHEGEEYTREGTFSLIFIMIVNH